MNTLFPIENNFPEGFSYHPDFISKEEGQDLLEAISKTDLHTFLSRDMKQNEKLTVLVTTGALRKELVKRERNSCCVRFPDQESC